MKNQHCRECSNFARQMTRSGTYLKTALLFIVFSMNTAVSFACSFSSLFHTTHHQGSEKVVHGEGKKHDHEHTERHHAHTADHTKNDNDECCSSTVVIIEKIEKAVSRNIEAPTVLIQFTPHFTTDHFLTVSKDSDRFLILRDRWRYPTTIHDLRIVIQSFQI